MTAAQTLHNSGQTYDDAAGQAWRMTKGGATMQFFTGVPGRSSASDWVWVLAFAAVYTALFLIAPRIYSQMFLTDSESYIDFWAIRTAYYPLLLQSLLENGFSADLIVTLQLAVFVLALAVFLKVMMGLGAPRLLLGVFSVFLGANFYFNSFHDAIHTESLTFSLTMLALAFLFHYLTHGRLWAIALAGVAIGLGAGIRPSFLFFAPAIIAVLICADWVRFRRMLAAMATFVLAVLAAYTPEQALYYAHHEERDSLAPRHLFGKAVMIMSAPSFDPAALSPDLQPLAEAVQRDFGAARVDPVALGSPNPILSAAFAPIYEMPAQWHETWLRPELDAAAARLGMDQFGAMAHIGRETIAAAPLLYADLTAQNYLAHWIIGARGVYPEAFDQAPHQHVMFQPESFSDRLGKTATLGLHTVFLATGAVVALVFVFGAALTLIEMIRGARFAVPTSWRAAFYLTLFVHAHLILTSMTGVALLRYLMAVYPLLALIGLFTVLGFVQLAMGRQEGPVGRRGAGGRRLEA